MKTPISWTSILLSLIFLLSSNQSFAGHTGNSEISYQHISGNTYKFTIVMYIACGGVTAPMTMQVRASSPSLSVNGSVAGTLLKIPNTLSVPAVPPNLFNCSNTTLCYTEVVYTGNINLNLLATTPFASDWVFYTDLCCNPGIFNNVTAGSNYAECRLNNFDFPNGNNSPFFHDRFGLDTNIGPVTNYPYKTICAGRSISFYQNAVESDGDIIRYEFITPLGSGAVPLGYINGFSLATPLPFTTPPGFEIDSITGKIDLEVPASASSNNYLIGIRANEFRMDTILISGVMTPVREQIGSVYRELLIVVEGAATCPDLSLELKKSSLKATCEQTEIKVEITEPFLCSTADKDASFVQLTNATTSASVLIDSVTIDSCWNNQISEDFRVHLDQPLLPGSYYLTVKTGSDGNTIISECGLELTAFSDTIVINVDSIDKPSMLGSQIITGGRLDHISLPCGSEFLKLDFTEDIYCNSIDTNGSDFLLYDSTTTTPTNIPISKVEIINCTKDKTKSLKVFFSQPLVEGHYGLFIKKGNDGNTALVDCNTEADPASIGIIVDGIDVDLGKDFVYCKGTPFQTVLDPVQSFASYKWSTGDTIKRLTVTTKGIYILTVNNGLGCIAMDTVIVTEKNCNVGIEEKNSNDISLYPNPANDILFLNFSNSKEKIEIQIYGLLGKQFICPISKLNDNYQVNTSQLPAGVYFMNVKSGNENIATKRFLINRE